jgi:catechol 2,3-dioxygenase-like lactoylglutathione lyase family enzyme
MSTPGISRTPTVAGIVEAALYVDDVPRAVQFYETVLGFETIELDERLTAMSVGGKQVLLVCKRGASTNIADVPHDATGRQHVAFSAAESDMDAWAARLREHGVTIERDRRWDRGGRSLYFRDPEGHILELASPGVWTVY